MDRTLRDILSGHSDLWAAALQAVLLAAVLIPGSAPWSGPALLSVSATHGIHLTDLAVVTPGCLVLVAAARRGLVRELAALLPSGPGRAPAPAVRLG